MAKVLANTWVNPWADFLSIVCIAFLSVVLIYLFICKPPKWNGFRCDGVCNGGYLLFVILIRVRKYKKHS